MSNSNGDRGIEMAVDKESLVVCQTFKSGNTQLVTFVGREELTRLRAAVDEALGSEPAAKRLPQGSLWIGQARLRQGMLEGSIRLEGDISGGDILDPTPSKNGAPPEKGTVRREEWSTPVYEQPEGCVLRNQRLYEVTEEGRIGIPGVDQATQIIEVSMWIVKIKKGGWNFWRTICGCATEEEANKAGVYAVGYFNNSPEALLSKSAGCAELSMFPENTWEYKVEYHEGEWIGDKPQITKEDI